MLLESRVCKFEAVAKLCTGDSNSIYNLIIKERYNWGNLFCFRLYFGFEIT